MLTDWGLSGRWPFQTIVHHGWHPCRRVNQQSTLYAEDADRRQRITAFVCVPSPLREVEYREGGLCTRLQQRIGPRGVPKAGNQVWGMPESGLHPGIKRGSQISAPEPRTAEVAVAVRG